MKNLFHLAKKSTWSLLSVLIFLLLGISWVPGETYRMARDKFISS